MVFEKKWFFLRFVGRVFNLEAILGCCDSAAPFAIFVSVGDNDTQSSWVDLEGLEFVCFTIGDGYGTKKYWGYSCKCGGY